jgi:hypothetical protein
LKVTTETDGRLVLTGHQRLVALAVIAMGPGAIWLGLKIVAEGDTEWFGWSFATLGIFMISLGFAALFVRHSLTLDRDQDMIRFSVHRPVGRRNRVMAISDLDRVVVRTTKMRQSSYESLVFVPRDGAGLPEIKISNFWTKTAANDAHFAVAAWLKRTKED